MKRLVLLLAPLMLVACASSPTTTTNVAPGVQFSQYTTYRWLTKPEMSNPLNQQRIIAGIDQQLQAKGWKLSEDGQVGVAANVASSQKQNISTFYTGGPYAGWGWGGGMGMGSAQTVVRTYDVGTLVVDMFDVGTKQGIWRGTASDTVPDSPQQQNALIDAAIVKMFAGFPPGSAPAAK